MNSFPAFGFSRQWLIDVELTSSQRDKYGDPIDQEGTRISGCLLGVTGSDEGESDSDQVAVRANLYLPPGSLITSQHLVETFPGAPVVGLWAVEGEPVHWPMGVVAPLRKESVNG